ncbi:hypothetical protein [Amycolatopsis sp. ATCC 39116]|uniref:hypothetical protein n=1 Tax=Amycolatopsis sp. (strain ATCC 39116 / 75iv2) TaxID=385957 RepID=UPI0012F78055|nr:hypothetical protein [Amycolatopsis sp. ATCC 39116]
MRVLCTALPGSGLFLPTVSMAWALRAAGREVLLLNNASAPSPLLGPGCRGEPLPERDLWPEFMEMVADRAAGEAPRPLQPEIG